MGEGGKGRLSYSYRHYVFMSSLSSLLSSLLVAGHGNSNVYTLTDCHRHAQHSGWLIICVDRGFDIIRC